MYIEDVWSFQNTIEHEIKFDGKYGCKGERRNKKTKATPEQIKKQNQKNKEKRMRRLIEANFHEGDYWLTIKYKKTDFNKQKNVEKDLKAYIDTIRRRYRKQNEELKYIYRIEIGSLGGVHVHMIVNRIRGSDIDLQKMWKHGRVNFALLDSGPYKELAEYITKPPDDDVYKQLTLFPKEERKKFIKYSCSRNLIRPLPERKKFKRRTVKKMILEGIKPKQGFYVVKDSIRIGINPYTGKSYIHYMERRLVKDG